MKTKIPYKLVVFLFLLSSLLNGGYNLPLVEATGFDSPKGAVSSQFTINKVIILGEVSPLIAPELEWLKGFVGKGIYEIDLELIRDTIIRNPWVGDFFIERKLPNLLIAKIDIKKPVAAIQGNRKYLLAAEQTILPWDSDMGFGLPVILLTENELQELKTGTQAANYAIRQSLKLLDRLEEYPKLFDKASLIFDWTDEPNLILTSNSIPVPFLLGVDAYLEKIDFLGRIWSKLESGQGNYALCDLRYKNRVIIRFNDRGHHESL